MFCNLLRLLNATMRLFIIMTYKVIDFIKTLKTTHAHLMDNILIHFNFLKTNNHIRFALLALLLQPDNVVSRCYFEIYPDVTSE